MLRKSVDVFGYLFGICLNGIIFAVKKLTIEFMKKPLLLLFLLYLSIPGQAIIVQDTIQTQRKFRNEFQKQSGNDTLSLIEKVWLHTDRTYFNTPLSSNTGIAF